MTHLAALMIWIRERSEVTCGVGNGTVCVHHITQMRSADGVAIAHYRAAGRCRSRRAANVDCANRGASTWSAGCAAYIGRI